MGFDIILQGLLVNGVTWGSKRLLDFLNRTPRWALRAGVAVLSYLSVLGASALNEEGVDPLAVETFVDAIYTLAVSQGVFLWSKK